MNKIILSALALLVMTASAFTLRNGSAGRARGPGRAGRTGYCRRTRDACGTRDRQPKLALRRTKSDAIAALQKAGHDFVAIHKGSTE